jgi:hypothetical protein
MFLRARGVLRTGIAVAAIYVFVLQILLTGVVATQMAAAAASPSDFFVICYGVGTSSDTGDKGHSGPTAHQTCVICAAASTVPLSPAVSQSAVIRFSSAVAFRAPAAPSFPTSQIRLPRTSRGPPQVA